MSLEATIAQKTAGTDASEVLELVLDGVKASKVTGLNQFTKLKVLQLNGCGLTSLEEFPTLPNLQRLELADNALSDGLDHLQDAALMHLKVLVLAGNKFSSLQGLESLASLPSLRELDMEGCAVADEDAYRETVFEMLPQIKYLDGVDGDGEEKDEEDEDEEDEEDDDEETADEDVDSLLDEEGSELGGDSELGEEGADESDLGEGESELGEEEGEEGESELGDEEGEEGVSEADGEEDGGSDAGEGSAKRQRR